MNRVKFYSNGDLLSGYNFNKAIEFVKKLEDDDKYYNINDIIELYNILKFFNESTLDTLTKEVKDICINSKPKLNKTIKNFCDDINDSNLKKYLNEVDLNYIEDFFEILNKYKIYKKISNNAFEDVLNENENYMRIVITNKELVLKFDEILRKYLLINKNSAELLLYEYEIKHIKNHVKNFFPKSLTKDDREKILVDYINSDLANLNYLRIIVNLQSTSELSISNKTKLLAKRKIEKQEKDLFDKNSGIRMSTTVKFEKNLTDTVKFKLNCENMEFTYSIDWIEENIDDFSTLLNNFIYLFNYVDMQMRWTVVSKFYYMGVFERSIFIRSKRDYPVNTIFYRLNQLAEMQLYGYCEQLKICGVRIEDLILWFFNYYLPSEFNIKNFNINMPSKNSSFLEKCRTILPELDSCLKQFNYYVEDGIIDPDLVQMSSNHMFFKDIKSLLKNKYVYSNGKEFDIIAYCFFSDQCMLGYFEKEKKKYENFYELLMNENIKKDEIVKYEQTSLNKLINHDYIFIDNDGYIKITNKTQLYLLKDLNDNAVISYWRLNNKQRNEIDLLVKKGLLKFSSSLFSKPEQDYLNYNLNKSEFVNSLDLRNQYEHGTQPFGNEKIHHNNYIKFLKLFILIIIKINDELCINDEINNNLLEIQT